jgi:hypothetical protein
MACMHGITGMSGCCGRGARACRLHVIASRTQCMQRVHENHHNKIDDGEGSRAPLPGPLPCALATAATATITPATMSP